MLLRFSNLFFLLIITHVYGIVLQFFLFTKNNPEVPITLGNEESFDTNKPLVIIIHGYLGFGLSNYCLRIKDEYLKKQDANVLILDWSKNRGDYGDVVMYGKIVGKILGEQIVFVLEKFDNVHLIGLGIGSHVAGIAGKRVKKYGNTISRITALDPVQALFNLTNTEERLYKEDASQVIVYHCDGNNLGYKEPIGTVDFYINGGEKQPGCKDNMPTFLQFLYENIEESACSHNICRLYFTSTINSNSTIATRCNSAEDFNTGLCKDNEKVIFGDDVPQNTSGIFYLNYTTRFDPAELSEEPTLNT